MNHERQQRNIQIKINSNWIPASDEMEEIEIAEDENEEEED